MRGLCLYVYAAFYAVAVAYKGSVVVYSRKYVNSIGQALGWFRSENTMLTFWMSRKRRDLLSGDSVFSPRRYSSVDRMMFYRCFELLHRTECATLH